MMGRSIWDANIPIKPYAHGNNWRDMANLFRGSRGTTKTRADEDGVSDARLFLPRGKKFGKQAFGRLHWQYGVRSGLFGVSQAGSRLCVPIPHVLFFLKLSFFCSLLRRSGQKNLLLPFSTRFSVTLFMSHSRSL